LRDNRTGRIEFAELPTELKLLFGSIYRRNNGVVSAKQGEFTVDRGKFDADTKDPAAFMALLQQARAVPVMGAGGGIEGFRMESLEAGSVFESLGLQVGDVIKQVNGQKLNGVSQASELFSALKDSNSIQLEIVRSGKPQSLKYTLR
jgi:type II secretion system protein C